MLSNNEFYQHKVMQNIYDVASRDLLPSNHIYFLETLSSTFNVKPKVIYDIGAAVLHWERHAKRIFGDAKIFCFDAFSPLEELYIKKRVNYHMCCLSNVDNLDVKFYQNDMLFGGNSIYKEKTQHFPSENYIVKKTSTLDTIVKNNNLPFPDMIKMDIQGNELNALKGASECLKHCTYLILEMQKIEYNEGAPLKDVVIEYLKTIGYTLSCDEFSKNIADSDSFFINTNKTNLIIDSNLRY